MFQPRSLREYSNLVEKLTEKFSREPSFDDHLLHQTQRMNPLHQLLLISLCLLGSVTAKNLVIARSSLSYVAFQSYTQCLNGFKLAGKVFFPISDNKDNTPSWTYCMEDGYGHDALDLKSAMSDNVDVVALITTKDSTSFQGLNSTTGSVQWATNVGSPVNWDVSPRGKFLVYYDVEDQNSYIVHLLDMQTGLETDSFLVDPSAKKYVSGISASDSGFVLWGYSYYSVDDSLKTHYEFFTIIPDASFAVSNNATVLYSTKNVTGSFQNGNTLWINEMTSDEFTHVIIDTITSPKNKFWVVSDNGIVIRGDIDTGIFDLSINLDVAPTKFVLGDNDGSFLAGMAYTLLFAYCSATSDKYYQVYHAGVPQDFKVPMGEVAMMCSYAYNGCMVVYGCENRIGCKTVLYPASSLI